jgi:hypothetical protein
LEDWDHHGSLAKKLKTSITPSSSRDTSDTTSSPSIKEPTHHWEAPPINILHPNPSTLHINHLLNSDAQFIGEVAPPYTPPPAMSQASGSGNNGEAQANPWQATPPPNQQFNSQQLINLMQQQAAMITQQAITINTLQASLENIQAQMTMFQAAPLPAIINIPANTIFNLPATLAQGDAQNKIEVARPPAFEGKMMEVDGFLNGRRLYIQLRMRRLTEMEKIFWVLSYMQKGSAKT